MNPIVGIENVKYNENLIEYNTNEEISMIPKTLFDVKFNDLKNTFIIKNENKVYEFIRKNENVFNLLEEVQPQLRKNFGNEKYYLEVRCYPEIYEKELALIIKVDYSKEDMNELNNRLLNVDLKINRHKIELGLLGKFFIMTEST